MDLFFVCRFPSIICHTSISSSAQSLFSDNEVDLLPPLLEVVDNIVQEDEDDLDEDDEEDEMEDAFMDPIDMTATSSGSETSSGKIPDGAINQVGNSIIQISHFGQFAFYILLILGA